MKKFEPMYKEKTHRSVNTQNNEAFSQSEAEDSNMSFISLYTKLYNENFEELEKLRKKERNVGLIIIIAVLAIFVCVFAIPTLVPVIALISFVIVFVVIINVFKKSVTTIREIRNGEFVSISTNQKKSYKSVFKEKIIAPILQNQIPSSEYIWYKGINRMEYASGEWESFDLFSSEDQIVAPINIPNFEQFKSELVISEVHTQNETRDSEGKTRRTTVFHGLAGYVTLPKDVGCYIKVTKDKLKLFGSGKNKLDMDMSEFEKIFDVETNDKIKAMQILTADVMTDLISLLQTSRVKFEFHIDRNRMHIRFHIGELFEPSTFGKSMQLDMLKRYCDITKNTIKTVEDICNIVMSVEL